MRCLCCPGKCLSLLLAGEQTQDHGKHGVGGRSSETATGQDQPCPNLSLISYRTHLLSELVNMGFLKHPQPLHQYTPISTHALTWSLSVPRQHGKEEKSPELALAGGAAAAAVGAAGSSSSSAALRCQPGICSHLIDFYT